MTIQTVGGGLWIPAPNCVDTNTQWSHSADTILDAAGEQHAVVFRAPKAGDIAKIVWRTKTVTTGDDIDVRLETVDATSGEPTGTLATANSNGTQTVQDTDDNTVFETALTANHTAAANDILAIVIEAPDGYVGNIQIAHGNAFYNAAHPSTFPYSLVNAGGGYSKDPEEKHNFTVEYSDGSYAFVGGLLPAETFTDETYSSATTPNEIGLKFQLPFPFRLKGLCTHAVWAGSDTLVKLYATGQNPGGTTLETKTFDKDFHKAASLQGIHFVVFDSPEELAKDTAYRLTFVPQSATSNRISYAEFKQAAQLDCLEGGQNFHWTEENGAGGWTDRTARWPAICLLIDGFDDGTGGGGGGGNYIIGG